ncbi:uncharacterized protein BDZ83DRAFT_658241 [Colletotrichum acutatum]|uniref:Uncharacterized protein n=1 Tax=Glomerella acutata TaxID=27357 RepID=A0AAD8XAH7_GLOAC|nr:uncharacterized protein BDZ83DRAFT_658241 [Colletotrichum acutatum]KAK1704658.1 hypothetical protein BDZ83DRAFT_658241 [Colletotrichum acutatum]
MAYLPSLSLNARVVIVVPLCLTNLLALEKEEDRFLLRRLGRGREHCPRRRRILLDLVVDPGFVGIRHLRDLLAGLPYFGFVRYPSHHPIPSSHSIIPPHLPFFTNLSQSSTTSSPPPARSPSGPSARPRSSSPPVPSWVFTSSSSFTQPAAWCPFGGIPTVYSDEDIGSPEAPLPAERWLCRPCPTPTIPGTGSTWGSDPTSAFAAPVTPIWKVGRALGRCWTGCTTARRTRGWTWGASRSLTTIVGGCGVRSPWRLRSHTCSLWVGLWSSTFTLWGFSASHWRPLEPGGRCPQLSWLPEPFPSFFSG